ncbi:MAG: hypothetical protein ACKVPX_05390 [Myxococcaceae bacterium]
MRAGSKIGAGANVVHGPEPVGEGKTRFNVWSPEAKALSVILMPGGVEIPMTQDARGVWSAVTDATVGARYLLKFGEHPVDFVSGRTQPDPFSRWQPDGAAGPSAVYHPSTYRFQNQAWRGQAQERLNFYELHVGTLSDEGSFRAAESHLRRASRAGYTVFEPLPVAQFPGSRNWGYDGVYPAAIHNTYGGPRAYQELVDVACGEGLDIAADVVLNHLGPHHNYAYGIAPHFRKGGDWGDSINYDVRAVRDWALQVCEQYLRDFRVNVLRLDAVHAILDKQEPHIVAEIVELARRVENETGRKIHVIAETNQPHHEMLTHLGCHARWNDDFHHCLWAGLFGVHQGYYAEFADSPFNKLAEVLRHGSIGRPGVDRASWLLPKHFLVSLDNHDQVGNRPLAPRLATLLGGNVPAQQALFTLLKLSGFIPLTFAGQEYGETRPFNYFTDFPDNPSLALDVQAGRQREHTQMGWSVSEPAPDDIQTFRAALLVHATGRARDTLRLTDAFLNRLRAEHAQLLGNAFPDVALTHQRVLTMTRPGLKVEVNLSPDRRGALEPWGAAINEKSLQAHLGDAV